MSDSKNRDDNKLYKQAYDEARNGGRDPLKYVVERLFFSPHPAEEAGRAAGERDRRKYGPQTKTQPDPVQRHPKTTNSPTRTALRSGTSGGSSPGVPTGSSDVAKLVVFAIAGLTYLVWVISVMNSGGPSSAGEFVLVAPGVLGVIGVGLYFGAMLIGAAIGIGLFIGFLAFFYHVFIGG